MILLVVVIIFVVVVNLGFGVYFNKLLSVLLMIFNLCFGFWIFNLLKIKKSWFVVWWFFYFFYELFGNIGIDKKMINISDGGYIENLGVMELLCCKCKFIVLVDAGVDFGFIFLDLENFIV